MKTRDNISKAAFLRWMNPVLVALKELGGQGTPQEVRSVIAKNEKLTEEELTETRGITNVNKFKNEVAFARNYLVIGGYIDKSIRGVWKLTEQGWDVSMTDRLASDIFKYRDSCTMEGWEFKYEWIYFYTEFANKLSFIYKEDRLALIGKIKRVYKSIGMKLPKLEKNDEIADIDPFTVFALFNKRITDENRIKILTAIAEAFEMKSDVPRIFDGIPVVSNLGTAFYYFKGERGEKDIDNLWELFFNAVEYTSTGKEQYKRDLKKYYDIVRKQKGINWNITTGLYWISPHMFISLDSRNREFLNTDNVPYDLAKIFDNVGRELPDGESYLTMCELANKEIDKEEYPYHSFYEFSYYVWRTAKQKADVSDLVNFHIKKSNSFMKSVKKRTDLFFENTSEEVHEQKGIKYPLYSKEDFLNEVYINEHAYDMLKYMIETKYSLILQGPPGVGKTFAAKRLAYSIMGEKDTRRVMMVQFHQSYSYEDFIQGYKPSKNGFVLKNGVFYEFCKKAEEDNEREYFFIVDEINRGNLSKIFGELMMLIERNNRGEKIKLLYSDEWFAVPRNVRIIGMLNTADRSIALMDYALRRRFNFFNFIPAFSSGGFRKYLSEKKSSKLENLINVVEALNNVIFEDASLGEGFRIGHSFFCTDDEITDMWLTSVVEYEVIPLLKEYWFDEPTKVRDWSSRLRGAIK